MKFILLCPLILACYCQSYVSGDFSGYIKKPVKIGKQSPNISGKKIEIETLLDPFSLRMMFIQQQKPMVILLMLQKSPVDGSEPKCPFSTGEFSTIPGVNFRISEEIKRFHNPLPRRKIGAWTKTAAWEIMACTERWTKRCRTPEKGPFFFWGFIGLPSGKT